MSGAGITVNPPGGRGIATIQNTGVLSLAAASSNVVVGGTGSAPSIDLGPYLDVGPSGGTTFATGGTVTTSTVNGVTFKTHKFSTSGTFTVNTANTMSYLVVGGGGAGGNDQGGGGGAGVAKMITTQTISPGVYSVIVGNGGALQADRGGNGGASSFNDTTCDGGGGGGAVINRPGVSGTGCGGGGGFGGVGGTGVPPGTNGGFAFTDLADRYQGGGGGGMGTSGFNGSENNKGGEGGVGKSYVLAGVTYLVSGGGGGQTMLNNGIAGGVGGSGIGGTGAVTTTNNTNKAATSPVANTGSGGGGGSGNGSAGASGVVYISYALGSLGGVSVNYLNTDLVAAPSGRNLSVQTIGTGGGVGISSDTNITLLVNNGNIDIQSTAGNITLTAGGLIYLSTIGSPLYRQLSGINVAQPIIQYGTATILTSTQFKDVSVTGYTGQFTYRVFATVNNQGAATGGQVLQVSNNSATSFRVGVSTMSGALDTPFNWMTVGT